MRKFSIVVADPPYGFNDALQHSSVPRGAAANYSTMSIDDLSVLPVKDLADPHGCLLALWVPSSLLAEGMQLMHSWGFEQKQLWCWVKTKNEPFKEMQKNQDFDNVNWDDFLSFGMGRLGRNVHEIVLIGTLGKNVYQNLKNKSQRTVFFAPNLKHSKKPEILQDRLELMFPAAEKIELFARRQRSGWTCLGNEVGTKKDIRTSLASLLNG